MYLEILCLEGEESWHATCKSPRDGRRVEVDLDIPLRMRKHMPGQWIFMVEIETSTRNAGKIMSLGHRPPVTTLSTLICQL